MKLAILIPTVPSRKKSVAHLLETLEHQVEGRAIEILCLYDNKKMSVGHKRNKLLFIADAEYFTFIDDDDEITHDYIASILAALESSPDLVTFNVKYTDEVDEYVCKYGPEDRTPAHIHVWKSEKFRNSEFPNRNAGEDMRWAKNNMPNVESIVNINRVLYYYQFSSKTTEAQA